MFGMGWMSWFTTLGKFIISTDIIVWEITWLQGLQHSSCVSDIVWVLCHMSWEKLKIYITCSDIFRAFSSLRHYIIQIIWFRNSVMKNSWPWARSLHDYFMCLLLILESACCQELRNSNHVLFFMTWVS